MKKEIKMHQKSPANGLYRASRLPTAVKNFGNRQIRKAKKSK